MKVAIYPGSFNPWHEGHDHVLKQALKVFDHVYIAQLQNPWKPNNDLSVLSEIVNYGDNVELIRTTRTLKKLATSLKVQAVVKGLRNIQDFEYEKVQQYTNEDLGLSLPVFYVIADRNLTHVSSSQKRALKKLEE